MFCLGGEPRNDCFWRALCFEDFRKFWACVAKVVVLGVEDFCRAFCSDECFADEDGVLRKEDVVFCAGDEEVVHKAVHAWFGVAPPKVELVLDCGSERVDVRVRAGLPVCEECFCDFAVVFAKDGKGEF